MAANDREGAPEGAPSSFSLMTMVLYRTSDYPERLQTWYTVAPQSGYGGILLLNTKRRLIMTKELDEKIKASLVNGKLSCASAFKIAKQLNVSIKEVGEACNKLYLKISSCQLGCFP